MGLTELMLGEPPGGFIKEAALLPRTDADGTLRPPVDMPASIDVVFAAVAGAVGPEPDALGVVYFGISAVITEAPPLIILDWDLQQIDINTLQGFLPPVYARLQQLTTETTTLYGSAGLLIEEEASAQCSSIGPSISAWMSRRSWRRRSSS